MSDEVEAAEVETPQARGPIPYERFAAVNAEKRAAAKEAEALRVRVAALEAEVGTHKTAAETAAGELGALRDRFDLHRAGITDDDGAEVARMLYQRVPAEQRPAGGLAEWVAGFREAPDTAPKPLSPYLGAHSTPQAAGAHTPKRPTENAAATGRQPEPIDPKSATAGQIRDLVDRYRSQGRLAELANDPMFKALTGRR